MARSQPRSGEIGHYLKLGWLQDSGDFDQKAGMRLDRKSNSRRGTVCSVLPGIGGGDTLEAGARRNIGEKVCRATKDHEDQEGKNH